MVLDHGIEGDVPSRSFRLWVNGRTVRVAETPPMDEAGRRRLAQAYRALPEYCHIYDAACMHLHYAHLGAVGDLQVEVRAEEEIRSFRILPARRRAAGSSEGAVLRFTVGGRGPRYLIVRVNALPPLMLAVDEPEEPARGAVIDAGAFLTDPTGTLDQTPHLGRALAAVSGSGRTLRVPAGTYSIGQLNLRGARDLVLNLAPGCLLRVRPGRPGGNSHSHGLCIEACENVSVTGRGCIDHQAYEHYALAGNDYQHGMVDYYTANDLCPWLTQSPVFISGSRRIRIEGITIRNGRNFNINCRACDDVVVRCVKILTPAACTPEYADGINTGSCRDVLVEDCLVASNDDSFASGHYFASHDRRSARNHVVRGLLGWTLRGSGARLGFHTGHDQGDFTFERCDFLAMTHAGLLVHALRPAPGGRSARYGTIRALDCSFDAERLELLVAVEKAAMDGFELVDTAFCGTPRPGAVFRVEGDPGDPIGRLLLRNVRVDGSPVRGLDGGNSVVDHVARVTVEQ
jgi:hypothetical protein